MGSYFRGVSERSAAETNLIVYESINISDRINEIRIDYSDAFGI